MTIPRQQFLSLLKNTIDRVDWHCHADCLMDTLYHLLIETNTPILSKGMKPTPNTATASAVHSHKSSAGTHSTQP